MDDTLFDLCIVGAGMFGSAAARHASAVAGVKVCLIGPDEPTLEEKKSRDIFGAHYDEGRITTILFNNIIHQHLAKKTIKRYRELEELSGINFYYPFGCIAVGKKDGSYMRNLLEKINSANNSIVDLTPNNLLKRRYPFLKVELDDQVILDDSGAGHISARNIVAAQKKVSECQGCYLLKDLVDEITPLKEGTHKIICRKGMVLHTKRVLICTGAFTNFGKFSIPNLKIRVLKETAVFFKLPSDEIERLSTMTCILNSNVKDNIGAYILPPIQYPDGHYYLKIGHKDLIFSEEVETLAEIKEWYLSSGDPEKIKCLSKFLLDMLPGLKYESITSMTCVTCKNPSGQPYIDRVTPTVTVAAVGNGCGATCSDEIGRIAAHLSLTGKWDSELNQAHFKIIVDNQ